MAKVTFAHFLACAALIHATAAASAFAEAPRSSSFSAPLLARSQPGLMLQAQVVPPQDFACPSWSVVCPPVPEAPFADAVISDRDLPDTAGAIDTRVISDRPFSLFRSGELFAGHGVVGDPVLLAQAGDTRWSGDGWPWRRSGTPEYVAVSLAAAATAYLEIRNSREPGQARWRARNGFDESIRDALRLKSRSARDATHVASDALMGLMIGAPVIEAFATLGLRDARWDAQWQTQMINLESFALTSLVSSMMQNLLTRERPFVRNCQNGKCEGDLLNRSMPSGHVAFAFTGAGLLCTHQKYQAIYDDPAMGQTICAAGIGVSVLDGVLRIMSDRHYATDVAVGTLIGLFSGFALPRLLHYSPPQQPVARSGEDGEQPAFSLVSVTPEFLAGGAALSCDFRF